MADRKGISIGAEPTIPPKLSATVIAAPRQNIEQLVASHPLPAQTVLAPTIIGRGPLSKDGNLSPDLKVTAKTQLQKPTSIPGVQRKRLVIEPAELVKLSPLASKATIERAVKELRCLVADTPNERRAILWGNQQQRAYSELVSRFLTLSQDDMLVRSTGYLNRVASILESIDLQEVVTAKTGPAAFGHLLKNLNSRIDTPKELDAARIELSQLLELMAHALEPLLTLKDTLQQGARQVASLGHEVDAMALAALFLSERFKLDRPGLSQVYLERSMSLTQTMAQIQDGAVLRDAHIEQSLQIISTLQNVALVMIPDWLSSISLLTSLETTRQTPTQAGELNYRLRDILRNLKA